MPSIFPSPVVVLLVQVDVDGRETYAESLRDHGFLPIPVKTASDALTVAPHADVIVTETLLPGRMDGIEFIARLKSDERTRTIPVIALTVCAWQSERERAEKAGCEAFLARPCPPEALLREVRRVLASSQVRDVPGMATTGGVPTEPADHRGLAVASTLLKRPE